MITLILTFLLLHLIFYKPSSVLSCGLFGYVGKKAPDINAIKILGLYNLSRGTDSCGLYLNNEIIKGVGNTASFKHLSEMVALKKPTKNFTVLGHTRKASVGVINKDTAHPYEYLRNKKVMSVFTHNGTVKNYKDLIKEYLPNNINFDYVTDSQAIGHLLSNNKFEIFSEYDGAVTCVWVDTEKKNTIYIWKGASLEENKIEGDRPLYGLEVDGGMYYSSLEDSLDCLTGGEEEIINFKTNHLTTVVDGKIISEKSFNRVLKKKSTSLVSTGTQTTIQIGGKPTATDKTLNCDHTTDLKKYGGKVYWYKGRYWRNGHLLTGQWQLDDEGLINKEGKEYYFVDGIMTDASDMKDFQTKFVTIKKAIEDSKNDNISVYNASIIITKLLKKGNIFELRNSERNLPTDSGLVYCNTGNNYYCLADKIKFQSLFARKVEVSFKYGDVESIKKLSDNDTIDYDLLTEDEWQQALMDKHIIESLDKKSKEYWETLDWSTIDYDSMSDTMSAYYFEKAKLWIPEEEDDDEDEDDDITEEQLSDDFLYDEVVKLIDKIEEFELSLYEDFHKTELLSKVQATIEVYKDDLQFCINKISEAWTK